MSLINIANLSFQYDGSYEPVFENVSFQIDTDWKLGFTGRNGRGKTTFLKLLQGKLEYTGTISANGVAFDYFPFDVRDKALHTIDVLEGILGDFELWRLHKELSLLEVGEDVLYRSFETLSNGEQTKVLLAALFLQSHHFLLIDEPTNHLDQHARQIVSNYLNGKSGFILVSHDRTFLDNCIDHILSINKTNIEIQKGNFSSWQLNKERQDRFEEAENEKLQSGIRQLKTAAERAAGWSDKVEKSKIGSHAADRGAIGHKAAKMMKRSKSIESRQQKAIDEKSGLLKNIEAAEDLKIQPLAYPKQRLAEANRLAVFYSGTPVCDAVSFTVNRGDRIALCGKNGSGKSSILKLLLGENIVYQGKLQIGSGLIFSYVPQDASFLSGGLKEFAENCAIDESLFKAILRKLDFSRTQLDKDMREYSMGQKKKVLIAKSLCEPAHIYLWDEPLNYIDVLSRVQIEELLCRFKPTMLFVEHDSAFVDAVATQRICL